MTLTRRFSNLFAPPFKYRHQIRYPIENEYHAVDWDIEVDVEVDIEVDVEIE